MCGIVGGISQKINKEAAEKMRDTLTRRGPDSAGLFFDKEKGVFLGHRRLAIIDLSAQADQPFASDDLVIAYNGEIYNFQEIKEELKNRGYFFESESDTEVVLLAYQEWGVRALEKFQGMFAFSIWDKKRKKLFLCRDRFGVKPLYYFFDGQNFIFASEIKAILKFPSFKKEIDPISLRAYFQFGYISAPNSIFKNISKLEPGHFLEIGLDLKIKKGQYWSAQKIFSLPKKNWAEKEAIKNLEQILKKSFSARLVADVEVGIFLSGGVDSSLIASILAKDLGVKINAFTIGFENSNSDEAPLAKKIAEHLNIPHDIRYFSSDDLIETIKNFADCFDEPFGDASALPTLILAKFAREKLKVALSGDGGDELFWGYTKDQAVTQWRSWPIFWRAIIKGFLKLFGPKKIAQTYYFLSKKIFFLPRFSNLSEKFSKLSALPVTGSCQEIFEKANSYWAPEELEKLFIISPATLKNDKEIKDNFILNEKEKMSLWDIEKYLEGDILVKSDRSFLAYGLEAREPYLDEDVLKFSVQLPDKLKYKKGGKYLLKKILSQRIPKNLVHQPKTGFRPPIGNWWESGFLDKYLDEDLIKKQGFLNYDFIAGLLKKRKNGRYVNPDKIWLIVAWQIWIEKWF